MQYRQVPLAGLPISLVLLPGRAVAFVPIALHKGVIDQNKGQVNACFYPDEFYLLGTDGTTVDVFSYRVAYNVDDYPLIKEWLKTLKIQLE